MAIVISTVLLFLLLQQSRSSCAKSAVVLVMPPKVAVSEPTHFSVGPIPVGAYGLLGSCDSCRNGDRFA